ncbi:N-acetylmuramoyl-L-alanine amidase [Paramagnetospirillum magnetotacticum MS-1]|uniref:N-acetylmuramoyl-L-alanine amidase n=1 Tax=Paramagnetospirillum magnetotacticum MS-1 TaxID=272627 RepID=A0A0C2V6T7_PARME|nr:N-acetylmuramoyl-L-alanine amidase [Paramagnetospirillum magnetotacticum]KIM00767.1 N-acetylmuramoyl-L-alanine amidase [Paramagnetospirillum magnetotacticum MS-1]
MRTRPRFWSALMALVVLGGLGGPPASLAATASGARLGVHGEGVTRFVLDLSDQVGFKITPLNDPYRIAIDLTGTEFNGTPGISKPWGSVNSLHLEGGRIVLDLRKPALVKSAFIIAPRDGMGHRLVVDLADTTREAFMAAAGSNAGLAAKAPVPKLPAKASAPVPAPAPAKAAPLPEAPKPVEEFHLPEAVAPSSPSEAARPGANRIVVNSPNAPAEALAPPSEPVTLVPPPSMQAPLPVERPQLADKPLAEKGARTPLGTPMLSSPMPPPPERPAPPQPVAAPQPPAPTPVPAAPPPQQAVQSSAPAMESVARAKDGVPVIVIDPGHGGVDPGATGVSGTYEKHITLAMARELKAMLEHNGRYRVHLTRDRDVFIRLRERIAIARAQGADLFISLHADAVQSPQIRGLSVYTLSRNASDAEAQALAEKENKADLIAGIDLTHESADVANILIDLAQRETMNRSAGFATELVDEVGQEMDLLGNTHRFAGFAVLKAPDVPAVLVEMGYLSNESEEKMLRQPQYRARLAKSIAKAVERFFPPNLKAKRP